MTRHLGSYELLEPLGKGGMGEVWRARHTMLMRPAAVKVILQDTDNEPSPRWGDMLRRFEREAQATSLLTSPHTIQVYDFGFAERGSFYYAMELLEGLSAQQLVELHGPVPAERAVSLIAQACESLAEAHRAGLVHRDITPNNLFLCKRGIELDFVKVLDFGLVKLTHAPSEEESRLTDANMIAGTPPFLPPEVVHGSAAFDARADLYALGCVLYWLLTGKFVFDANTPLHMAIAHVQEVPVAPSKRTKQRIPRELDRIVLRCLAKDPSARFQTAEELLEALRRCRFKEPWTVTRAAEWWSRHYPALAARQSEPVHLVSRHAGREGEVPPPEARADKPLVMDRPSLAVLPFENRSDDPDQDYFSEGIAEDILVELSKFKSLFVIARPSSFAHKGPNVDIKAVAREFGVQYVVRGTVRRARDLVRITVQLIEGATERQVWGERFKSSEEAIHEVQYNVVRTIVSTLAGRVEAERLERAKRKQPAVLDAYECVLRGKELHHRNNPADADEAIRLFERAISLDPEYAEAHCWIACTSARGSEWQGMGKGPGWERCATHLRRAYELDCDDADVHRVLCEVAMWQRDFDRAQYHQDRAIELNPNDERVVCERGDLMTRLGRGDEAVEWVLKAMRLNPYHPNRWWSHLGRAFHLAGKFRDALWAFRRVAPPNVLSQAFMAACCTALGDDAAAAAHSEQVKRLDPHFEGRAFAQSLGYQNPESLAPLVSELIAVRLARPGALEGSAPTAKEQSWHRH